MLCVVIQTPVKASDKRRVSYPGDKPAGGGNFTVRKRGGGGN